MGLIGHDPSEATICCRQILSDYYLLNEIVNKLFFLLMIKSMGNAEIVV